MDVTAMTPALLRVRSSDGALASIGLSSGVGLGHRLPPTQPPRPVPAAAEIPLVRAMVTATGGTLTIRPGMSAAARTARIKDFCVAPLAAYQATEPACSRQEIGTTDALSWWKKPANARKFCLLERLARRYLAVRGNAANQEQIFSIAGKLYGKDRNRLSPALVDALIFLFVNGELDISAKVPKKGFM